MPFRKQRMMRYYKITVWFTGGIKSYTIAPAKYKPFMSDLRRRADIIKYVVENTYKYIS